MYDADESYCHDHAKPTKEAQTFRSSRVVSWSVLLRVQSDFRLGSEIWNFKVEMYESSQINRQSGLTFALLLCMTCMRASVYAQQPGGTTTQPMTPAPSGNTPTQSAPPSSSSGVTIAPSGNNPQGSAPPPASNARPLTPAGQTEQSVQPTTQADQQTRGNIAEPRLNPTPQGGAGASHPDRQRPSAMVWAAQTEGSAQQQYGKQSPPVRNARRGVRACRRPRRKQRFFRTCLLSLPTIARPRARCLKSVASALT